MSPNPYASGVPVEPTVLAATRSSLHEVAEQVLAADLYRHIGRIGLRPALGGFGTPWVIVDGAKRSARVESTELVLIVGEERTAAPLRTIREAAALLDVVPGAPAVYTPATSVDLDRPLVVDPAAAEVVAEWFAFGSNALERLLAAHPEMADSAGPPTLWPEHFDLAVTVADGVRGEVVLGVSPGDDADPDPYAYVAPSELGRGLVATDDWWNRPWGRWVPTGDIATTDDLVAFYEDGFRHVRRGAGGPG